MNKIIVDERFISPVDINIVLDDYINEILNENDDILSFFDQGRIQALEDIRTLIYSRAKK